jgi:high-affinity Fe2+/Pb2+ permease
MTPQKNLKKKGFTLWFWVVFASVVAAFVVPYVFLSSFSASLLVYGFWTVFAFVIVGFIYWGVKDWRDTE